MMNAASAFASASGRYVMSLLWREMGHGTSRQIRYRAFFHAPRTLSLLLMKRYLTLALIVGIAVLVLRHPLSPIAPYFTPQPPVKETVIARFALCPKAARTACVIDGDTIRYKSRRIRIIGIDAPELYPARCPAEQQKGEAARKALLNWLNQGPFTLIGSAQDKYARDLRSIKRGDEDVGDVLVKIGLAHENIPFEDTPNWCG